MHGINKAYINSELQKNNTDLVTQPEIGIIMFI